ncbi:MAG: hypothetical protein KDD77_18410 [Caldilineaceae bacterium]|nr:hypothetical protein [Caldilineaceae bacterium]
MANPEDFEIIPDQDPRSSQQQTGSRKWFWIAGIVLFGIFAFSVGIGWATLSNRLGPGSATEAPIVAATSQVTATPAPADATATAAATATPANPTATTTVPTATTPPTPTGVPTRVCAVPLEPQFMPVFDAGALGCPIAPASVVWAAYEGFERGSMLWRSDTNLSYILFNDGSWAPSNETWNGQEPPSRGDPPAGLYRPERGFGYVWGVRDDVFTRLGWATMPEKGFCAAVQPFEQGFALASALVESCTPDNLYNQAFEPGWQPLLMALDNTGRWRGAGQAVQPVITPGVPVQLPATSTATATTQPTAVVDTSARPAQNGVFTARPGQVAALDGQFNDWPGPWIPLNTIMQGQDQWAGGNDLAGAFQLMWSADGLYVAVQITDDVLRSGPDGSDQWQGDGIEIQFDRRLADDFADTRANDDDTQIGLAPDSAFQYVRGYRWLPLAAESRFDPPGAVTVTPGQYNIEVLVPWLYFDMGSAEAQPGARFGFNLSLNDNDAETPAQQTVLSASPARTTHDNPTEWGTLVLGG